MNTQVLTQKHSKTSFELTNQLCLVGGMTDTDFQIVNWIILWSFTPLMNSNQSFTPLMNIVHSFRRMLHKHFCLIPFYLIPFSLIPLYINIAYGRIITYKFVNMKILNVLIILGSSSVINSGIIHVVVLL